MPTQALQACRHVYANFVVNNSDCNARAIAAIAMFRPPHMRPLPMFQRHLRRGAVYGVVTYVVAIYGRLGSNTIPVGHPPFCHLTCLHLMRTMYVTH